MDTGNVCKGKKWIRNHRRSSTNPQKNRIPLAPDALRFWPGIVVLCGIVYGAYWYFYASNFVSTDNAYTATEVAQVTSAVSGIIREVNVVDTQSVKKGDILVIIDDTDAKLALNQAEADCAKARAELASAQSDYKRAAVDLKRRNALIAIGAVSGDELTKTENAHTSSVAAIESAKAAIAQATARIDQAKVDLSRTVIRGSRLTVPLPNGPYRSDKKYLPMHNCWSSFPCRTCMWTPTSRKGNLKKSVPARKRNSIPTCMANRSSITAQSKVFPAERVPHLR